MDGENICIYFMTDMVNNILANSKPIRKQFWLEIRKSSDISNTDNSCFMWNGLKGEQATNQTTLLTKQWYLLEAKFKSVHLYDAIDLEITISSASNPKAADLVFNYETWAAEGKKCMVGYF